MLVGKMILELFQVEASHRRKKSFVLFEMVLDQFWFSDCGFPGCDQADKVVAL
jgi:hypothetical protein